MEQYDWPGNIRELGAVIDRAAILAMARLGSSQGTGLQSWRIGQRHRRRDGAMGGTATGLLGDQSLSIDAAMKAHIEHVLHITKGRIEGPQGAAKLLEINPHTLRARMRKLESTGPSFEARALSPGFDDDA